MFIPKIASITSKQATVYIVPGVFAKTFSDMIHAAHKVNQERKSK